MMKKLEKFYNQNQEFHLLTLEEWKLIKENKEYEEIEFGNYLISRIDYDLNIKATQDRKYFKYCIYRVKLSKKNMWFPMWFININHTWYRFHLERIKCENCDLFSYIANPSFSELYVFLPNQFELLKEVWNLPHVNCPNCDEKIERLAIWAKLDENQ